MPSTLPGSFASAAAGNGGDTSARTFSRAESGTFADWARRSNGATQTFRRSSTTNASSGFNQAQQRDSSSGAFSNSATYVPSHVSAGRNGSTLDTRYSKIQLLELFREQKDAGEFDDDISDLSVGEALSTLSNGVSTPKWVRRDETKSDYNAPGPEICWERSAATEPLGLMDMTEEEKELFASSVNSPLKGPNQSTVREGGSREGVSNRKASTSHASATGVHGFGLSSPMSTRSAARRRDPSDSFTFAKDELAPSVTSPVTFHEEHSDFNSLSGTLNRRADTLEAGVEYQYTDDLDTENTESNVDRITSPYTLSKGSGTNVLGADSSKNPTNWNVASTNSPTSVLGGFGSLGLGGQSAVPAVHKRSDIGPFRESRFRGLMNPVKTSDGLTEKTTEKPSMGSSVNIDENDVEREASRNDENALERLASDQYETSAVMDKVFAESPYRPPGVSGSTKRRLDEELGLEELNRGTDNVPSGSSGEYRYHDQNQFAAFSAYDQHETPREEALSPTFTNPYSSPQQQPSGMREVELEEHAMANLHLPGLGEYHRQGLPEPPNAFGARRELNRSSSYDFRQPDRSIYQSSNANRGFQPLGAFGGLGSFSGSDSWAPVLGSGTPIRERGPFGEAAGQALPSPNVSVPDHGPIGYSTKLGSLVPAKMQEHMRAEQSRSQRDDRSLQPVAEHLESLSRASSSRRELESPYRNAPAKYDDFTRGTDVGTSFSAEPNPVAELLNNPLAQTHPQHSQFNSSQQQYLSQAPGKRSGSVAGTASNQPPAAQQKTMVMPDRIRWIYRDPQGNTQGPWSGLEMHDWYRAGFFSPELLVKKVEDADYEPLAQLIRRIGNSREPFLVPQIGIPGPPSTQPHQNWPNQPIVSSPSVTTAGAQPPFAGSFPSFGTTLTAEQQNALERRKQEEQYLMARQKEHLAQQQLARQMQGQHGVHVQQLQHHSSTQSLQSQPSYGSMTSPSGFQTSPPQGINHMNTGMAGTFESAFRGAGGVGMGTASSGVDNLGQVREAQPSSLFSRVNLDQGQQVTIDDQRPVGRSLYADFDAFEGRTASIIADRARLEQQQEEYERLQQSRDQDRGFAVNERLMEFQDLRGNMDNDGYRDSIKRVSEHADALSSSENDDFTVLQSVSSADDNKPISHVRDDEAHARALANLSLTEQVQQAASSKQSSTAPSWTKTDTTAAAESTSPQSTSPLPAPAARRGRPNVADALAAESLSQSQSPAEETPSSSIAPWAKEPSETQKQPSLREIQESEARKVAKHEEAIIANRRAALERDVANQLPVAPGLPSSSTWGSSESPLGASATGVSPWAKPVASKTAITSSGPPKKSLQQIQAEEEVASRKKKASAVNNATIASHVAGAAQAMSSGKRYADLAGKAASPSPPSTGAWTTVGASGKAKVPSNAATATLTTVRPGGAASGVSSANVTKPKNSSVTSKTSLAAAKENAQEELKKWATAELRPDLDKDIQVEEFVQTLLNFPSDTDIITEVVHQNSSTIDSRHFAEEFVRRRGLAEKGKTDANSAGGSHYGQQAENKGGGWNEVARKGSSANAAKDEPNGAFRIVAAKKKGKK